MHISIEMNVKMYYELLCLNWQWIKTLHTQVFCLPQTPIHTSKFTIKYSFTLPQNMRIYLIQFLYYLWWHLQVYLFQAYMYILSPKDLCQWMKFLMDGTWCISSLIIFINISAEKELMGLITYNYTFIAITSCVLELKKPLHLAVVISNLMRSFLNFCRLTLKRSLTET